MTNSLSNCTIKNNTLISLGGGIDVARLDNYNNTITGNNITCQNGYNIKITASINRIENNTLINTNNASGTKISVVYIYGKQAEQYDYLYIPITYNSSCGFIWNDIATVSPTGVVTANGAY